MNKGISNGKGFTLLEVMIVIAIIGILLGAFGTAMAHWLPDYRFNNYVLELKGAIENARIAAAKNNSDVVVNLSMTNSQFSVFVDNNQTGTQDAGDVSLGVFPTPDGVSFTELLSTTTDQKVTFSCRGFADTSGNICLKNGNGTYKGVSFTLAGCTHIIRSGDSGGSWN